MYALSIILEDQFLGIIAIILLKLCFGLHIIIASVPHGRGTVEEIFFKFSYISFA